MKHLTEAKVSTGAGARFVVIVCLALLSAACSDDSGSSPNDGNGAGGSGGSSTLPVGGGVDPAVLAACPPASTLLETTEWPDCLSGTRLLGVAPFSGDACALSIGDDAAFEYSVGGKVVLQVPKRGAWENASGTYQNTGEGARLIFLASVAPDLPAVDGEPRVTNIGISIFGLAGQDDKVEVTYLDGALARQTYNCTLNGP